MADKSATDSLKPGTAIVVLNIIAKNGYMTGYTFHNVTGKAWADVLDILDKPEHKPSENGEQAQRHQSRVDVSRCVCERCKQRDGDRFIIGTGWICSYCATEDEVEL